MADEVEVFVDYSVKQKLLGTTRLEDLSDVYLCGDVKDGSYHIVSCEACTLANKHSNQESDYLPEGLKICGIFYITSKFQEINLAKARELVKDLSSKKSSKSISEPIVIWQHCQSSDDGDDSGILYNSNNNSITKCSLRFSDISATFLKDRTTFRIQTSFEMDLEYNLRALRERLKSLSRDLQCPSTTFLIKDCNMLLHYCDNSSKQSQTNQTCQVLLDAMVVDQEGVTSLANRKSKSRRGPSKTNEKMNLPRKDAIDVKLLTKITSSENGGFVPVIYFQKEHNKNVTITFPVDAVVMVCKETPVTELPKMFLSAVARQLSQIHHTMQLFSKDSSWCIPRPYHFKPPGFCHLVTLVYPETTSEGTPADDQYLESYRTELHKRLLLPLNRPLLRVCNSYIFDKDRQTEPYLVNPHSGMSSSGVSSGTTGLVDGYYSYHHYMQDNFNDDKWGCAYRSLQTICSWFRHQGYTRKHVPSHREIQQALVDVGDKQSNFVGSKQWIGSFEVSMCLEHLLGVTSKIMFVNSGAEMANKGRELLHHFETQGTPIMIGGGVLAHTILGVDFDQQSGDIKFLILDPHYTGSEDLKTILDKGWCGWKGPNFWNQQAHYNMCMPQRPDMI